ncbi:MAG: hypothetical protein QOE68_1872 [Thermoanaerobaculia bacterium]|nr:hypothetical protein [Thermoanaerobaculia bacterium]
MTRKPGIVATLLVCAPLIAQAPRRQSESQRPIGFPATTTAHQATISNSPATAFNESVQIFSTTAIPYPYLALVPTGDDGWSWCWLQSNMNYSGSGPGRYFWFHIPAGKKFLFDQDLILRDTARFGIGDQYFTPIYDLDISKTDSTMVSGMFRNASSTGGASMAVQTGNDSVGGSSRNAYTLYRSLEGSDSRWWYAGMTGTTAYRIRDYQNNDRITITQPDGNGAVNMTFNASTATFTGTVSGGVIKANYQDVAEWVPATESMEPGTVVVLNTHRSNEVTRSTTPYDTKAAGVVSAQPGVILGIEGPSKAQIATTGRVKVRVDATHAAIRVGDLLVTGTEPGTAMRSEPLALAGIEIHRPGTVIGKALEPLASGRGEILVLLTLQ